MKRFARAGIAVAALSAAPLPALAADLPQPAETASPFASSPVPAARFDWTGAYAGGNLGWVWGQFENSSTPTGSFDADANGVAGGIHGGYNFAITPNIITGIEADLQFTDLEKRTTRGGVSVKSSSTWNSTVRGRVGYAFERFMAYGTGGLAIADVDINANGASDDAVAVGWTAGAGIEGAVTDRVSARLEYLYQDFGRETFTLGGNRYRSDLDNSTVRFGLSYHF
ncbi:MAG: porin family protein [Roseibium sp.]|nr:porin family protein [Roseibium sp.]